MKEQKKIYLFDLFFLWIGVVTLFNVGYLLLGVFVPIISLLTAVFFLLGLIIILKIKIERKDNRFHWIFLIILALALFLRFSPNLYITGGQDQGTYVSMSKQYEINNGLYIKGYFRESMPEKIKELYDRYNVFLGVGVHDLNSSEYVMPFYPAFPSWMSVFGSIFGSDNRIYALTLFSILSIVGVYLLTYEISGRSKKTALLASFFMVISPIHLYFSKIPLTEIVSLTFLCFSFYYLLKFYNEYKTGKINIISLLLSIISANALFYTRMSGLFLLPIMILIPLLVFLFAKDKKLFKFLGVYSLVWILSLFTSYLFYYFALPDLFEQILGNKLINDIGWLWIIVVLIAVVISLLAIFFVKKIAKIVSVILKFLYKNIIIIFITIFVSLIFYELYFYIKEILIDSSYTLFSNESLSALKQLSFLVGFLYLTPIGFVLLPGSVIYLKRRMNAQLSLLIFSLLIFLIYCWGVMKDTPYHYYFTRYQFSELIPFATILLSIFLVDISKKWKTLTIILIALMSVYLGYFSYLQTRNTEGGSKESYLQVADIVKDSVVFIDKNEFVSYNQIGFPLRYYYGIKMFAIRDISTIKDFHGYLLSSNSNLTNDHLKFVKEIDFRHNYFVHCNRSEDAYFEMESHSKDIPFCKYIIIPNRYYKGIYKTYVYELN